MDWTELALELGLFIESDRCPNARALSQQPIIQEYCLFGKSSWSCTKLLNIIPHEASRVRGKTQDWGESELAI